MHLIESSWIYGKACVCLPNSLPWRLKDWALLFRDLDEVELCLELCAKSNFIILKSVGNDYLTSQYRRKSAHLARLSRPTFSTSIHTFDRSLCVLFAKLRQPGLTLCAWQFTFVSHFCFALFYCFQKIDIVVRLCFCQTSCPTRCKITTHMPHDRLVSFGEEHFVIKS